jgi:hypothetical protein
MRRLSHNNCRVVKSGNTHELWLYNAKIVEVDIRNGMVSVDNKEYHTAGVRNKVNDFFISLGIKAKAGLYEGKLYISRDNVDNFAPHCFILSETESANVKG